MARLHVGSIVHVGSHLGNFSTSLDSSSETIGRSRELGTRARFTENTDSDTGPSARSTTDGLHGPWAATDGAAQPKDIWCRSNMAGRRTKLLVQMPATAISSQERSPATGIGALDHDKDRQTGQRAGSRGSGTSDDPVLQPCCCCPGAHLARTVLLQTQICRRGSAQLV